MLSQILVQPGVAMVMVLQPLCSQVEVVGRDTSLAVLPVVKLEKDLKVLS